MIGWGIDRRVFFSFFFHPVMHYLHFLPAAAVTGVSLPGSNDFERWHGAELTSRGQGTASLSHSRKRRSKRKPSWLESYSSVWKPRRALGLCRLRIVALMRAQWSTAVAGHGEETTGCLRPEYDRHQWVEQMHYWSKKQQKKTSPFDWHRPRSSVCTLRDIVCESTSDVIIHPDLLESSCSAEGHQ